MIRTAIDAYPRGVFGNLHVVRRELLLLRRAVWPLRDAISELRSEVTPFITDEIRVYLRDCYDHAVQLIDLLESYRDIADDVRDYYFSSISNRMNEIMITLTVIATIFLPLSFIAGVYGMNFNPAASKWNMPELNWRFGYPYALALMLLVAIGMILSFKRRGWLARFGEGRERTEERGEEWERRRVGAIVECQHARSVTYRSLGADRTRRVLLALTKGGWCNRRGTLALSSS